MLLVVLVVAPMGLQELLLLEPVVALPHNS